MHEEQGQPVAMRYNVMSTVPITFLVRFRVTYVHVGQVLAFQICLFDTALQYMSYEKVARRKNGKVNSSQGDEELTRRVMRCPTTFSLSALVLEPLPALKRNWEVGIPPKSQT